MAQNLTTTPDLQASIEAAKSSRDNAMRDLAGAHAKLRAEYDTLGERIEHLWRLPLPREVVLGELLDAVDKQAEVFPIETRWSEIFPRFLAPTGGRPIVSKTETLRGSREYRHGPLSLADLIALRRDAGSQFLKLEKMLMSQRDHAGGVLSSDVLPVGFHRPARDLTPASFLGLWDGTQSRPATQHQLVTMLCFFMPDAVKARLRAAFDAAVPAAWPARPEDVSAADWRMTPDERMTEIVEAATRRAELLEQMRGIDLQSVTLAPDHDLSKLARVRAGMSDAAY